MKALIKTFVACLKNLGPLKLIIPAETPMPAIVTAAVAMTATTSVVVAVILSFTIFPNAAAADTTNIAKKANVVTSFSILENITQQIAKDEVNVTNLIGRESDAHDFEPRAKHIILLKNADLFILNGLNFEPWADKFIKQNQFAKSTLNLGAQLKLAAQDQNPHIWQNPELLIKYINLIKEALIQLRPEAKNIFSKNALVLTEDIQNIHKSYLQRFKELPQPRWLITPHNGFYHLAQAYGFEYIYLSSSGHNENLSAKSIKQLIDKIKPLKNAFLFDEWGFKSPLLAVLEKETHQKNGGFLIGDSLTLEHSVGASIQDYIRYNNETLLRVYNQ